MRAAKGSGSIRKNKSGSWSGYVPVDGKRVTFTAKTKREIEDIRRQLIRQRDTTGLSTSTAPTLTEWCEHWLQITRERHKPSTHAVYTGLLRARITPAIGRIRIDKLTIEDLERFYGSMSHLSGSTRHQAHSIVRAALTEAVRRGHVHRNVAALVQPPSASKPKKDNLSLADTDAILAAARGDRHEFRWHLALRFGLRPGEALAVEFNHLQGNRLHIRQQLQTINGRGLILIDSTKTGSGERTIILPPYMLQLAQESHERQQWEAASFPEWALWEWEGEPRRFINAMPDGHPVKPRHDDTLWKRLLASAGLPPTRRYAARHTAASILIANGIDVAVVADVLGHADPSFTMRRYVAAVDERKEELANMFESMNAPKNDSGSRNVQNGFLGQELEGSTW